MTHITITGHSGNSDNIAAVLRGYVERFELTSPMVKQMMLDAADEIERLRAWAEDEQSKRHKAEEDRMNLRAEIASLQAWIGKLAADRMQDRADNDRLRAAAKAFEAGLSSYCDGPERDVLRAALEPKP